MPPGEPRYRAAPADSMRVEQLDTVLTAAFHRPSGITHLLAEPAPEILAILAGEWLTSSDLLVHLANRFELEGDGRAALSARLGELEAAGLVEIAPA